MGPVTCNHVFPLKSIAPAGSAKFVINAEATTARRSADRPINRCTCPIALSCFGQQQLLHPGGLHQGFGCPLDVMTSRADPAGTRRRTAPTAAKSEMARTA